MTEEWRDIKGYPHYQVSNLGRVRRLPYTVIDKNGKTRNQPMIIMQPTDAGKGYRSIGLWKNGKQNTQRLCRIVATAFCDNPHNYPIVNHKDCDVTNDHADNLEWCNHSYNNSYNGAGVKRSLLRERHVDQYTLDGKFIRQWHSIASAQRSLGIGNIWRACSGECSQAGNYIWKFSENQERINYNDLKTCEL